MFTFFSIHFFSGSYKEFIEKLKKNICHNERFYVCVTGVHGLVEAERNARFRTILNHARYTVPDGMPVVWAGNIINKNTKRIYGPRLMEETCAMAEAHKFKIYLYGTTPQTLQKLRVQLLNKFPHLLIVGAFAPPFTTLSKEKIQSICKTINDSQAQIVFVGLSTPKQEFWMHETRPHLRANTLIGVGAAFDFLSGVKRQAPFWIQQSGLEWLFRLIEEPKRLGKRYMVNNCLFLWFVLRRLIRRYLWCKRQHAQ